MCDYLKLVPNEEKEPEPVFTYDSERAKESPPGVTYLGTSNVRDLCPTIYPSDNESPETKERCERALKKFWIGEEGYCTVGHIITLDYNQSSMSIVLQDTEDGEFEPFKTEKSWEEMLEAIRKEFSWINSPESGLTMNMTEVNLPEEEIRRMKIEIKGVYPFLFPFLKYWPAPQSFLLHAIHVKFQQHLYDLIDTLRRRTRTPEQEEDLDEIILDLKKAFAPFEKEDTPQPKLHVISNEHKGESK